MTDDDDVSARDVELEQDGCPSFTISFEDGAQFRTHVSIPGAQSVVNVLFAAALAHRLGVAQYVIDEQFAKLEITGRRTEVRISACGARIIDDSYNAAPESMAAALDLLAKLPATGSRRFRPGATGTSSGGGCVRKPAAMRRCRAGAWSGVPARSRIPLR